mgnify:CR=1 FL=1
MMLSLPCVDNVARIEVGAPIDAAVGAVVDIAAGETAGDLIAAKSNANNNIGHAPASIGMYAMLGYMQSLLPLLQAVSHHASPQMPPPSSYQAEL